ncbi:MAG TPA: RDD family protein [Steroidobacteraceae bacterium]|nr:RDD family protein [Steroidobacteraceae bacterium]
MPEPKPITYASPFARLVAGLYDLFPALALLMAAGGIVVALRGGTAVPPHSWWFTAWLLLVLFGYYGWSWKRGGQTMGMRAWRIAVRREDGASLEWAQVALRFAVALAGTASAVGLLWMFFDRRRRALHDLAVRTVVVKLPRD